MKKNNSRFIKKLVNSAIIISTLAGTLIIWEFAVGFFKISPIVLVKPSEIFPVIISGSEVLLKELDFTFTEVLYGWLLGNVVALVLATLMFSFKKIVAFLVSFSIIINAVPLIALAAIIGGFVGTDQNSKTLLVALLCFFPMLIVSLSSFANCNGDYGNLFRTYNSSFAQRFFKLIVPHSLPAIGTTLKINVITAITTAIVSEFFGAHGGIGQFILARKGFYDLPMVWAAIFFVVLAGAFFYMVVGMFLKKFIFWT